MFSEFVSSEVSAIVQVILIDLVLAGDNAIVVGMAAAGDQADLTPGHTIIRYSDNNQVRNFTNSTRPTYLLSATAIPCWSVANSLN